MGAIVAGNSVYTRAAEANMTQLAVTGITTTRLAGLSLRVTILIQFAMNTAAALTCGNAFATTGIGRIANFSVGAILIA